MALEITGKLIKMMPEQTGTGKNGAWVKQDFIIETAEQYPKKICVSAWGDKVETIKLAKPGDNIKVAFNLESREYNDRWYTDIRAWKIELNSTGGTSSSSEMDNVNSDFASNGADDDLPF